ncbi:cilia- and flagella-associated protein 263 isoform X4 [Excalfactoria chinensis]|uniref:cilia- and flagella-associated protein 263 isoform X4 n=1 Tax=Excalfactoria chinensis TaxID=46218 RepID=UPI003B3A5F03
MMPGKQGSCPSPLTGCSDPPLPSSSRPVCIHTQIPLAKCTLLLCYLNTELSLGIHANTAAVGRCWFSNGVCVVTQLLQTRGRSRSRLRSSSAAYFAALTAEQKCDLAERELQDVKSDIQKMEEDSEKTLHDLEAVIREADVWWADIKKVASDFEEDIVKAISNKKGSITASEKLLRYLEEKNHQRELMRQKLRLESNLLRSYKKKLQQQLRQKVQVGDVLSEVHAELLQVKKAQYEEEIDEKNKELQQLKLALEKIQIIDFWKKKLHSAMETSTALMKDISQRKEMLEKTERKTTLVKEQQAKEKSLIGRLQKQLSDYSTPPVMNYVQTMMAVADLEKSIKTWERKVAIAEVREMGPGVGWVLSPGVLLQAVLEALPVGCSLPPEQRLNFNN